MQCYDKITNVREYGILTSGVCLPGAVSLRGIKKDGNDDVTKNVSGMSSTHCCSDIIWALSAVAHFEAS